MCGIYVITLESDKVMYVGKSKHIEKRVKEHIEGIDKGETKMYWLLHQMELMGVRFWVVEECEEERLSEREAFWIKTLKPVLNTQIPAGGRRYVDKVECVTDAYTQALENGLWKIEGFLEEYVDRGIREWLKIDKNTQDCARLCCGPGPGPDHITFSQSPSPLTL